MDWQMWPARKCRRHQPDEDGEERQLSDCSKGAFSLPVFEWA
jgi:hypothetical protein